MKLVRYGPPGREKPGLIDDDGKLRDLSRKVKDIDAMALAPGELAKLRKLDTARLPHLWPHRTMARHHGRDQGSAESRYVARRQWRASADRQHSNHDFRRR